jgi:hypothetical protein
MGASPHSLPLPFYIKKKYLKAKEEEEDLLLWKLKYFTMQKYNLSKNPCKKKKIQKYHSRYYYNSVTNLKFQFQHKPKYIFIFQKCLYIKKNRPNIFIT